MFYPQFLLQPYPHVGETGVESFKGRTGVITPETDDYTAGQITETADRLFLSANERQRVAGLDVASIAALKDITVAAVPDKMLALVGGYSSHGDGGGGIFYYDAAETADDNGGTVIAPNSGSGRWKRVLLAAEGSTSITDDHTVSAADSVLHVESAVTITVPLIKDGFSVDIINASLGMVTIQGLSTSTSLDAGYIASVIESKQKHYVVKGPASVISV